MCPALKDHHVALQIWDPTSETPAAGSVILAGTSHVPPAPLAPTSVGVNAERSGHRVRLFYPGLSPSDSWESFLGRRIPILDCCGHKCRTKPTAPSDRARRATGPAINAHVAGSQSWSAADLQGLGIGRLNGVSPQTGTGLRLTAVAGSQSWTATMRTASSSSSSSGSLFKRSRAISSRRLCSVSVG